MQGEGARVRGCYYDPASGMGVFGMVPLIAGSDAEAVPDARLGLRYSTPTASLGIIVNPFSETVTQLWAVSSTLHALHGMCHAPCGASGTCSGLHATLRGFAMDSGFDRYI